MKNRRFRLEPVLRIRRMEERASALAASDAARSAHQAATAAEASELLAAQARLPVSGTGGELLATTVHTSALAADAVIARATAEARSDHANALRTEWTSAAQRMKVLEKLQERHLASVQRADEQAEARTIDDLVTRSYAAKTNHEGNN